MELQLTKIHSNLTIFVSLVECPSTKDNSRSAWVAWEQSQSQLGVPSSSASKLTGLLGKRAAVCEHTHARLVWAETECQDTIVQASAANSNDARVHNMIHGLEGVGAQGHITFLENHLKSLDCDNSSLWADQAKLVQVIWDFVSSQSRGDHGSHH